MFIRSPQVCVCVCVEDKTVKRRGEGCQGKTSRKRASFLYAFNIIELVWH